MKLDVSTEDVCTMFMEGHNFVKISTKFILLHEMYGTSGTILDVVQVKNYFFILSYRPMVLPGSRST
jgi:hypothetical protein